MSDDLGFDLPEPPRVSRTKVIVLLAALVAVVVLAFVVGYLPKRAAREELEASTKADIDAVPRVQVVMPKVLASDRALVLPGSVQAVEQTIIHPRANGYVRERHVDIGDEVDAGTLLVVIDSPELDQQLAQANAQLAQAKASLAQARANRQFADTDLARHEKLAPAGVVSQQELDRSQSAAAVGTANVSVAEANVAAQEANVRRLAQEKSFTRVTAPFAGKITTRSVDKGQLVTPTTPLLTLAATDPARVLLQVPQDVAPSLRVDVPAAVRVREYGGRAFQGKVARFADALDPQTRTMLVDVRVPNPHGELLAGMYAEVEITLPSPRRALEIPATALVNDARGTRVAVVTPESTIKLVPVGIERDTGPALHIATGLQESDRVVRIASAELVEGRRVEVAAPPPPPGSAAPAAK